jgi:hypothetical protein
MWAPALLAGHSAWFDLARVVEFDAAIRAGDFFPTWSPDFYSGYGSPIFQFYAPLAYYLTEVPVLAGLDFPAALKVTQCVALFASGLAMYRLASTHFSGWAACLGGVLYMLAPYRLVDMFVRHALAEHCAFVWLPLIVWGTERFVSKSSRIGFATGALSITALILTHNIMALIGLPVCIAAGWMLASPQRGARSLAAAGAVAVLGVGMAAFFWWPAMSGRTLVQAEASLTGGYFDFHRHFVEGWQFVDLHWHFGISAGKPGEQMPLQIGLPHLFAGLGALALVAVRWSRRRRATPQDGHVNEPSEGDRGRRRATWSVIGILIMAIGVIMCSRWSQPLWEVLPLVKYVQFPWRFLGLVVFGAAICGTALVDLLCAKGEQSGAVAGMVGLIVIMATYFPYYSEARFLVGDGRTKTLVSVSAAGVDALEATGALIPLGRATTTADLRGMHERATSGDDFLPRGVKEKPSQPPSPIVQAEGGQVIETAQMHQNHYRSRLRLLQAGKVELLQFWFPGWQATVDGLTASTAPIGPHAIVSCDVPAGDHVVEFSYHALPQRRTGILVSILSAILGACALFLCPPGGRQPEGRTT